MRKSLSLCMIVKNEEDVLERCLTPLKSLFDEIIIVDTGSTDKTKEIAYKFTDKVFDFEWCDDFSKARNFSFSKAESDYIMWLDADDIITQDNIEKINFLLLELKADIVMCLYDISFDSNGKPVYSYYRERILKKSKNYEWVGAVHEVIVPSGHVVRSDISIEHRKIKTGGSGDRNLKIYQNKVESGEELSTRDLYYYGRELYYNQMYNEAIDTFNLFLSKGDGYMPNVIDARLTLKKCLDAINKKSEGIEALLMLLKLTTPTAEICCEIGAYFIDISEFEKAVFWYKLALKFVPDPSSGAFINKDYYGIIPCLNLCFCYYKLGDKENARHFNDLAGEIRPRDNRYLYNKDYFEKNI